MRGTSFLRYAIVSVFRNRRRSLFAMIGVALALSLMAGSFIAVDSSSMGVLRAATDAVPVDFIGRMNDFQTSMQWSTINDTADGIMGVKYVEQVSPVLITSGFVKRNESANVTFTNPYDYGRIIMLRQDEQRVLDSYKIKGQMPDRGSAAISRSTADALGIAVGGVITLQAEHVIGHYDINETYVITDIHYVNLTFVVSQIWTQERTTNTDVWYYQLGANDVLIEDSMNPVVLSMEDSQAVFAGQKEIVFRGNNAVHTELKFCIWLDRGAVISLADVEGSVSRIDFAHNRLEMKGNYLGFSVDESSLGSALQTISPQLASMKVTFLVLSLPVIALGIYLSLVGVDLGLTGRRREAGMLKSRGASNRQVFGSMLLESAILGVIAAVIGLVLGVVISRFLMGSAASLSGTSGGETAWYWTDLQVSTGTVLLSLMFGVLLMILSTYRPFKRISRTPVAEALHHYSPLTAQTRYRPGVDYILLILSGISIISVLVGMDAASGRGWSWMTELIVSILIIMGVVIFPLMPFFLSLGVVRLLTRGSHRLYAKFTALVRPWTKELTYLVDRNIVRNPRRAANLGVIISLSLAFGLFISVTMESSIAYEKEVVKYDVGSDIKITSYSMRPGGAADGVAIESIASLEGVEHAVTFSQVGANLYSGYVGVSIMDVQDYMDAVNPGNFYFVGHSKGILMDLEENGTCLVREDFARDGSILEGDTLRVFLQLAYSSNNSVGFSTVILDLEVIGLSKALPGTDWPSVYIDWGSVSWMNRSTLLTQGTPSGVIIKTDGSVDPRVVASQATQIFSSAGMSASAQLLQDRLDELSNDPIYGALTSFLYMEYALAIAIMAVGVGLIIFVAVNDREHELACIMARGSSSGQMRKILMGESMTLMSLGLIVGASVGMLTAYLFNTLYGDTSYASVDRRMVFTWVSMVVVAASVVSLLVASILATARAGRIRLTEVLRIRGG